MNGGTLSKLLFSIQTCRLLKWDPLSTFMYDALETNWLAGAGEIEPSGIVRYGAYRCRDPKSGSRSCGARSAYSIEASGMQIPMQRFEACRPQPANPSPTGTERTAPESRGSKRLKAPLRRAELSFRPLTTNSPIPATAATDIRYPPSCKPPTRRAWLFQAKSPKSRQSQPSAPTPALPRIVEHSKGT
jgi:hypothetical protein